VSTQEIDFTAGTESHPNDPHVETPGRVRPVAVPPAARTLSTLPHIDDEDAFLVETGPAQDRTGEQWARAILEDAPIIMRRALRWGWFALGLRLGSTRSDRFVLGCKRQQQAPFFATFVQQENHIARAVWAGVAPVRRLVVRYLLERASRRILEKERDG